MGFAPALPTLLPSPLEEAAVGALFYLTDTPGTFGRIKEEPEDFVVVERTKWPPEAADGNYLALEVRARNWEANRLAGRIARELQVSRTRIGFAGTKDKRAVTTRGFTVRLDQPTARVVRLPDVEVLRSFRTARPLGLGDLTGNSFDIHVTGFPGAAEEGAAKARATFAAAAAQGGFANFFGTQRFGSLRPVTHTVGAALVEGDFAGAVRVYLGSPSAYETEDVRAFRTAFRNGTPPIELLRAMPHHLSFERQLLEALAAEPDKPLAAIERLPRNLALMFVHAHQSELFNRVLSQRLVRGLPLAAPVVGDLVVVLEEGGSALEDSPVAVTEANQTKVARQVELGRAAVTGLVPGAEVAFASGEAGEIERKVLEDAGRTAAQFVIPDLPRLTTRGVRRPLALRPTQVQIDAGQARSAPAVRLRFELPRGCYATVVLREVIKRPESAWARESATAVALDDAR
jgi:tRNA pseudouridine13 synthase